MKKNTLILIAAVVIAFGLFYVFGKGGTPVANQEGVIQGEYTLQDIIDKKEPYECTFVKNDGASNISGAIKVGDDKVRADFDITLQAQDGGSFASHFIMKDGTNYVWTSIQPVGYKAMIVNNSDTNASAIEQAQIVGLKDKIDYTCKPWNANLTVFETPSGVTFLELPQS